MKRRWIALSVAVLALLALGAVIAAKPGAPPAPTSLPVAPVLATPEPEFTEQEVNALTLAAHEYWDTHVPVVNGKTLALPGDAQMEALIAYRGTANQVPADVNISPLPLPVYLIVRDGEMASVSAATGEFQIGQDHQETFQFLVTQLGRDKMQLVDRAFYENRWGPYRANHK